MLSRPLGRCAKLVWIPLPKWIQYSCRSNISFLELVLFILWLQQVETRWDVLFKYYLIGVEACWSILTWMYLILFISYYSKNIQELSLIFLWTEADVGVDDNHYRKASASLFVSYRWVEHGIAGYCVGKHYYCSKTWSWAHLRKHKVCFSQLAIMNILKYVQTHRHILPCNRVGNYQSTKGRRYRLTFCNVENKKKNLIR